MVKVMGLARFEDTSEEKLIIEFEFNGTKKRIKVAVSELQVDERGQLIIPADAEYEFITAEQGSSLLN